MPTVTGQTPTPGTAILPTTPIAFTVTGISGAYAVGISYPNGLYEVAYDGAVLAPFYLQSSTVTALAGGSQTFSLVRTGGWQSATINGAPTIQLITNPAGAGLGSATPQPVAQTAVVGTAPNASHEDHVHADPVQAAFGAALGNADATIAIAAGVKRALPASTLTANHTLTVSTTGAVAGSRIMIRRDDVTKWTYALVNGGVGAGTLITLPGGLACRVWIIFDGTNWALDDTPELYPTVTTDYNGLMTPTMLATLAGGVVSSVGATLPIVSTGGTTPVVSINAATPSLPGSMSAADKTFANAINTGTGAVVSPSSLRATGTTLPIQDSTGAATLTLGLASAGACTIQPVATCTSVAIVQARSTSGAGASLETSPQRGLPDGTPLSGVWFHEMGATVSGSAAPETWKSNGVEYGRHFLGPSGWTFSSTTQSLLLQTAGNAIIQSTVGGGTSQIGNPNLVLSVGSGGIIYTVGGVGTVLTETLTGAACTQAWGNMTSLAETLPSAATRSFSAGSFQVLDQTSSLPFLEYSHLAASSRVVSLCRNAAITTTNMPANSGDGVINLAYAIAEPTVNCDATGVVIYAKSGGQLRVREPNGFVDAVNTVDSAGPGATSKKKWEQFGRVLTNAASIATITGPIKQTDLSTGASGVAHILIRITGIESTAKTPYKAFREVTVLINAGVLTISQNTTLGADLGAATYTIDVSTDVRIRVTPANANATQWWYEADIVVSEY